MRRKALCLYALRFLSLVISEFGAHAVGIRVHRPRCTTAGSKAANVKGRVAARQGLPLTEPPLPARWRA
jgi:hypothetical protein